MTRAQMWAKDGAGDDGEQLEQILRLAKEGISEKSFDDIWYGRWNADKWPFDSPVEETIGNGEIELADSFLKAYLKDQE